MLPPGRRITFQSAESWNDGLLEHALVKHTGLTPEEVKDRLAAFVHRLDTDMRAGVRVEIPALGVLRLTADGELRFAEEGGTTAPEMFGLLEIDMQPVGEELPPAPEFAAVTPEKKRNYRCPMVCWILLALVLLAVGMYIFRRPLEQWLDRMVYTPEELEYLHQNY